MMTKDVLDEAAHRLMLHWACRARMSIDDYEDLRDWVERTNPEFYNWADCYHPSRYFADRRRY